MTASFASLRAVLVEDNSLDQRFAERFKSAGLPCELLPPSSSKDELVEALSDGEFDLVILDYRLDDLPEVSYRGGSVAAELKERNPLLPIALFTAAEKRADFARRNPSLSEVFDYIVEKESAQQLSERRKIAGQLGDLAVGFRRIRQAFRRSRSASAQAILVRSMKAKKNELPTQTHVRGKKDAAPLVARRILKSLLRYPGPLVDESKARALLGLTKQAFRRKQTLCWLGPARYDGVFSEIAERWWKGRTQSLLLEGGGGDILSSSVERVKAVAAACGVRSLRADFCNWCGRTDVIHGCENLREIC